VVEPSQTTRRIGFDRSSVDTYLELPREVTKRQGSVLTTRLREVCRTCNGGWMSRLEQQVAPVLERMWSRDHPLEFTALEAEQVRVVAAWAVKTAWVRERIGSPRITPTRGVREQSAALAWPSRAGSSSPPCLIGTLA
jgi:hypothetical protein